MVLFSLCVIHKEGLCPSRDEINRHLCEAGLRAGPDGASDDAPGRVAAAHEPRHVGQRADLRAPPLRDLLHRHPLDVLCKRFFFIHDTNLTITLYPRTGRAI
jgi:hypothetical protein